MLTLPFTQAPRPKAVSRIDCQSAELESIFVTWGGFLLLLLTAVCMAVANVLLKTGIARAGGLDPSLSGAWRLIAQPSFVVGFLLTGAGCVCWLYILSTQKLSTCYPLFVSITYALITLGAVYFLQERVSAQKVIGLAIIIAGITTVARG
jgi:multidrug transporter EmrE-like cation transporter